MFYNNSNHQKDKSKIIIPIKKKLTLFELEQMNIETNKKYFYIKNNYKEELEELQDSLGMSVNVIDLLDKQHQIIKVNIFTYFFIISSYRVIQKHSEMISIIEN